MTYHLVDFQENVKQGIYGAYRDGARNVMAVMPTGAGKCLGRDTPVLMFDGTTKMVQDVAVGDLLMGPDSTPRCVTSICNGREPLYRVTPTKGDSYVVNESHILSLKQTGLKSNPLYPCQQGKGNIVNIGVKQWLASSRNFKHTHKGWRTSVDFPEQQQPLDPYFFGLWLGDGHSRHQAITTGDTMIVSYLQAVAYDMKLRVRIEPAGGASVTVHIVGKKKHANPLRDALRELDVLHNKHVPHVYKAADRKQRLMVLAGLLDSDGSLSNGGYDYITKQKQLADDVAYIARSLGLAAYVAECQKSAHAQHVGTYWRVSISGDTSCIPCLLDRKKAAPRKQRKSVLVTGIQVEPIGEGDYYGFEITGDRLFLLGDFTVTHNTVLMGNIAHEYDGCGVSIAHRAELVSQISIALAREGKSHDIVAPDNIIRMIVGFHMDEVGRSFYNPRANWKVASVDTLVRREFSASWLRQVGMVHGDEGHHFLADNKWGRAMQMFPNAYGLLVTATPTRADGRGLGRDADGIVDTMVEGPDMRWLIDNGYLTDYSLLAPHPDHLDMSDIEISKATGDYVVDKMRKRVKQSATIVGDVVNTYLKFAHGKKGITFAVDVEHATSIAAAYRAAGVPAVIVHAKTSDFDRRTYMRQFRNGELLQLVNVDLFGEGVDVPSVEVVSMARPTASYSLFVQQFGRALRLLVDAQIRAHWHVMSVEQRLHHIAQSSKPRALIIDHVGNIVKHGGPPDWKTEPWTLDARKRSNRATDAIPLRTCCNETCMQPFERIYPSCPFCGWVPPEPADRSKPAFVDGDIVLYTPELLQQLFGKRELIDRAYPAIPYGADAAVVGRLRNIHAANQAAQAMLRQTMQLALPPGLDERVANRQFFHTFGVDTLSAQGLKSADAETLRQRIITKLTGSTM